MSIGRSYYFTMNDVSFLNQYREPATFMSKALPNEIWSQICSSLNGRALFKLLCASSTLFHTVLPHLWNEIKISPKCKPEQWMELVDMLKSEHGRQYLAQIRRVCDISLYIGAESADCSDSAIDLYQQPYSLNSTLTFLMEMCQLQHIRLVFHNQLLHSLPWDSAHALKSLVLGMRVTNSVVKCIFKTVMNITQLCFSQAEISDDGLAWISEKCPNLEDVQFEIVDFHLRSRYLMSQDDSCGRHITNVGIEKMFHLPLRKLHIGLLERVTPSAYTCKDLKGLTISLCNDFGISSQAILEIAKSYSATLEHLMIYGNACEAASLYDKYIPESVVRDLAADLPHLKSLYLQDLGLARTENGCLLFYGSHDTSWHLNEFISDFRARFPGVALSNVS